MDRAPTPGRQSLPPNSRIGEPRHRPAADRPCARPAISNGRKLRPRSMLNRVRTSCAPRRWAACSPARTAAVAPAPACCASSMAASAAPSVPQAARDGGELARALASHQRPELGRRVGNLPRPCGRFVDFAAKRVGHERAADQHGPAAAALLARPLRDRLADIAQRLDALDEGERLRRLQHVDAAADQQTRRAHARDQRQRRFELGREAGEIGQLGVVRSVSEDDRAARCRCAPPQRGGAREELVPRHPCGVPVGGPHQQRRLHRVHGAFLRPQASISASADRCCVSGSAPRCVNSTGSPQRR